MSAAADAAVVVVQEGLRDAFASRARWKRWEQAHGKDVGGLAKRIDRLPIGGEHHVGGPVLIEKGDEHSFQTTGSGVRGSVRVYGGEMPQRFFAAGQEPEAAKHALERVDHERKLDLMPGYATSRARAERAGQQRARAALFDSMDADVEALFGRPAREAAEVAEAAAREVLEAPLGATDPGAVADAAVAARFGAPPAGGGATKQRGRTGSVSWDAAKHKRGFHGRFAPGSKEEQTAQAQTQLHKHGEDPGPIDGQHGPRTESAIKRFQAKYGLKQTGKLDAGTVATLHAPPPKSVQDLHQHTVQAKAAKAAQQAKGKGRGSSKSRKSGRQSGGSAGPAGSANWQGSLSPSGVLRHGDGTQTKGGKNAARGSAQVQQLQAKLEQLGFDLGPAGTDGKFGDGTQAAVQAFQRAYGLSPDGVVGRHTKLMLNLLSQMEGQPDPNALSLDQMALSKTPKGSGGAKGARAQLAQMGVQQASVVAERAASAQLRS